MAAGALTATPATGVLSSRGTSSSAARRLRPRSPCATTWWSTPGPPRRPTGPRVPRWGARRILEAGGPRQGLWRDRQVRRDELRERRALPVEERLPAGAAARPGEAGRDPLRRARLAPGLRLEHHRLPSRVRGIVDRLRGLERERHRGVAQGLTDRRAHAPARALVDRAQPLGERGQFDSGLSPGMAFSRAVAMVVSIAPLLPAPFASDAMDEG